MIRSSITTLALSIFVTLLAACSGGTEKKNNASGDIETVVSQRLYGSIDHPSNSDTKPVSIEVLSYSGDATDNTLIDSRTTVASKTSQGDWIYDTEIEMAKSGGFLVVNMTKDGYAGSSKKVVFESPQEMQVLGRLVAAAEAQITVESNTYVLRSGRTRNSFTFALVENGRGERSLVAGASGLRAARTANSSDVLVIDIPADSVPPGTTELQGRMASFDPNDEEESDSFPGEYADSDGNELLSVAFQFNEITTADGQSLGRAVKEARARGLLPRTSHEPTIISRHIPAGSCSAMESLGDADDTRTGFQIPIYTYNPNSGRWELLGTGSVYYQDGTEVASDNTVFDCNAESFYLEIEVSNEDFERKWWNLDYPLTFDEPVELCARVQVQDQDGAPLGGTSVALKDDDGRSFSDTFGYTNADGVVTLNTTLIDGSDDRTAKLRYWGFDSASFESTPVTLGGSCEAVQTVSVQRRDKCVIKGTLLDEYGPASDILVYALGFSDSQDIFDWHYGYGQTNASGEYNIRAVCELEYTLYSGQYVFGGSQLTTSVDGVTQTDEKSDNGTTVVMNDLTFENQAPLAYAWFNWNVDLGNPEIFDGKYHYSLDAGTVDIQAYAWDWEGDWPIAVELKLIDSNGVVQDTRNQSLTEEGYFDGDGDWIIILDVPVNGFYRIEGTATDSRGNEADLINF